MIVLEPVCLNHHAQADALAEALQKAGLSVTVFKSRGHLYHPCLQISYGTRRVYVYTAPDNDQRWWFWWETLLPIAPSAEVSKAADLITRRLARM